MEEKVLIKFRNIVKEFDGTIVLKGINLDIYENEFVTLLGPSGCGKTTLLRALLGQLPLSAGQFDWQTPEAARAISYVPPNIVQICRRFRSVSQISWL